MTAGTREGLAVGLLFFTAVLAVLGLSLRSGSPHRDRLVVIALDRSSSLAADGCADLGRLGAGVLSSTVTTELIILSTSPSGIVRLGALRSAPSGRLLEGRGHEAAGVEGQVAELVAACEALPPAQTSPIALLVERALTYLPTETCAETRTCTLIVRTDGRESVDRQVRRALTRRRVRLEPRFANQRTAVRFCGLAEVHSNSGPRPAWLQAVWRGLFEAPEQVRFEAACALFTREVMR